VAAWPHLLKVKQSARATAPIDHTSLMHPTLRRAPFTRAGWIFEHKLDGSRALASTGPAPALVSRNGLSYAVAFPEIIAALRRFPVAAVIDAELVVVDREGHPQS
jgi:ATP-dependent DNA ligase